MEAASDRLQVPTTRLQLINRRCTMALYVIFSNAMRSAEYLRSTTLDIVGNDRLLIRGAKGSGSYMIEAPGIGIQFRDAHRVHPARFVSGTTYRQLWAACVRIGLGDIVESRENYARTHAARYRLAQELSAENTQTVADALRHRSQRSTLHYMAR
jgi:integrase